MHQREVWQSFGCATATSTGTGRGAWTRLLGAVITLIGLAALLPGPWQVAGQLSGHRAPPPTAVIDTAMLLVAALIVWSLLIWILGIAAVAAVAGRPGPAGRRARQLFFRIAPAAVRNVLLTVASASLLPGLTACGIASPTVHPAQVDARITVAESPVRLQTLSVEQLDIDWPARAQPAAQGGDQSGRFSVDWPASGTSDPPKTPRTARTAVPAPISVDWPTVDPAQNRSVRGAAADGAVVVHRGDSLWSIAARHLGADTADAEIARAWHRWYAANATVIGHDPNLILPGQILLPPTQKTGE